MGLERVDSRSCRRRGASVMQLISFPKIANKKGPALRCAGPSLQMLKRLSEDLLAAKSNQSQQAEAQEHARGGFRSGDRRCGTSDERVETALAIWHAQVRCEQVAARTIDKIGRSQTTSVRYLNRERRTVRCAGPTAA